MKFKTFVIKLFAQKIVKDIRKWSANAIEIQDKLMLQLVQKAQHTTYGKDHHFDQITNYEAFKANIPVQDYEGLRPYIEQIRAGKADVLWTGRPAYFAKTSGTTSGVKYIPITKASIPNHFNTARNALFNYLVESGNYHFLEGKMIFLSGSPKLERKNGILTGRLSGISNHMVPDWLKKNQLPSWETNCIEEWESKLDRIVDETLNQDLRLISGIPPWVQMYYERLLERTSKSSILDVFPNFSVFVYGGVNFEPYRNALERLVGKRLDSVETYPASEGFIAFQDSQQERGLLLNVASGIFFEFVPAEEIFNDQPTRLNLSQVELGVNYALLINNNAGLWGYNIGDTVEFVSLNPYRIIVTGRVKHFISAFGEHVIGKEVDRAMQQATSEFGLIVTEFTVAPNVLPKEGGLPYHEWFIEFDQPPAVLETFASRLDQLMIEQNIYYKDLIDGNIIRPLKISLLPKDAFRNYMKSQGKLGGQNKVPRLSNDRKIVEAMGF